MQSNIEQICTSDISKHEMTYISKVLGHYSFDVFLIEKVRSAFKLFTDQGTFCLKKIGRGYKRAVKSFYVVEHLNKNKFDNLPIFYPTKNNNIFIKLKKSTYYLTYWIESREISFNQLEEILYCTELLAKFHLSSRHIKHKDKIHLKSNYYNLEKSFKKNINDLLSFNKIIHSIKSKSDFDSLYIAQIGSMKREAELALKLINRPGFKEICDIAYKEGYLCHDSFYYQNVLIDSLKKLYLVDLESTNGNIPINDLGKFMRRILSRKKYKWDFELCRKIIDSYNKIRPLCEEEYYTLLAILLFPHKFWRIGAKRYRKKKEWTEEKYISKLKKMIAINAYKPEFIKNYIQFYLLKI